MIKKGDVDKDGQLDFDEFVKAIKADQESKAEGMTCGTILETIFLVVVTSLFEMGTSFSLPAAGALFTFFCLKPQFGSRPIEKKIMGDCTTS